MTVRFHMFVSQGSKEKLATHSGFGGSLANNVPSFRVRSFPISSGSLSVSLSSIGSNGLIGWWLFDDDLLDGSGAAGFPVAFGIWRLLRGGASGCAWDCRVEEHEANALSWAANISKSYVTFLQFVCGCLCVCAFSFWAHKKKQRNNKKGTRVTFFIITIRFNIRKRLRASYLC